MTASELRELFVTTDELVRDAQTLGLKLSIPNVLYYCKVAATNQAHHLDAVFVGASGRGVWLIEKQSAQAFLDERVKKEAEIKAI